MDYCAGVAAVAAEAFFEAFFAFFAFFTLACFFACFVIVGAFCMTEGTVPVAEGVASVLVAANADDAPRESPITAMVMRIFFMIVDQ